MTLPFMTHVLYSGNVRSPQSWLVRLAYIAKEYFQNENLPIWHLDNNLIDMHSLSQKAIFSQSLRIFEFVWPSHCIIPV